MTPVSENVLVAGAWREGVRSLLLQQINEVNKRSKAGFRLLPYESTVQELTELLDSTDELLAELLADDETVQ